VKTKIKITINDGKIILPLNIAQGGIRIADSSGTHLPKPIKTHNEKEYSIEWMITNDEIKLLSNSILTDIGSLIDHLKNIKNFADDSKYSKRETVKLDKKEIGDFDGFEIYHYNETFNSFEKTLNSGMKVRITFKLGDFGVEPHPHMYVLIPFNQMLLNLKNQGGEVEEHQELGKKCFGEFIMNEEDLKEIILTLAHSSNKHKEDLIKLLKS
jgi:hypothetical protein